MSADATSDCEGCGYDRAVTPYFAPGGAEFNDTSDSRILALGSGTIEATCSAAGQTATCEARRSSDFDFATDNGEDPSQTTSMYEFTVEDGLIVHYTLTRSDGNLFDFSHIQNYRLWLADNYPQAEQELFASTTILLTTDEQFAQHQQFIAEYMASESNA